MCTSETKIKCPICNEYVNQNRNRIIVELCGHSKCRSCFITEENGCIQCNRERITKSIDSTEEIVLTENENEFDEPSTVTDAIVGNLDSGPSSELAVGVVEADEVLDDVVVAAPLDSVHKSPTHIEVIKVNNTTVYKCRICHKQFKSRNNKKYHSYCDRKLRKPLQCNQCDKSFITSFHLQYHLKTHQTTDWFACNQCDKKYMREISLKKHLRKHKSELTDGRADYGMYYIFHIFSEVFAYCAGDSRILVPFTDELKFKCAFCDHRFVFQEQLRAHENRHKNNRHTCPECSKSFWLKSNLTKHILTHSGM